MNIMYKRMPKVLTKEDHTFMEHILYEAIFVPEGEDPPAKSIIYDAYLYSYIADWG